jgi:hypothetical protein
MQLEFAWILWSVVLQPLHMQQGCLHLSWDLIRMSRVFRSNQKKTDPKEHKEQGMMDQALESKNLLNSRTGATGCNMIMMQLCPSSSIIIHHPSDHFPYCPPGASGRQAPSPRITAAAAWRSQLLATNTFQKGVTEGKESWNAQHANLCHLASGLSRKV